MEICPDAPGAIELLRQYHHGHRSPMHLMAISGITTLALLWMALVITALST